MDLVRTVPAASIAAMAASALISIGLPIALAIYWGRKHGAKASSFFIGAAVFVVFALILEQISHYFFLLAGNPVSAYINGAPWAYVAYACLAAGLFEETGRYLAFRLAFRDKPRMDSVMYGIGHGGIEAMLTAGQTMLVYIIFALLINSGSNQAAAGLLGADVAAYSMLTDVLVDTRAGIFLVSGIERVIAIALHISLSVVVYSAVNAEGKGYLYPMAVLMHAGANVAAGMYQAGLVASIALVEAITAVLTAIAALFARRLYRSLPQDGPGPDTGGGTEAEAEAGHYRPGGTD